MNEALGPIIMQDDPQMGLQNAVENVQNPYATRVSGSSITLPCGGCAESDTGLECSHELTYFRPGQQMRRHNNKSSRGEGKKPEV